eukprot:TRINITY_DN2954_c0_g1_i1.p1 TRINITY_DN2954_c0_g1~~TRINITY_DN2954_c0_g1_i1.p1  ORF type:complete len:501 (+),score=115.84 TRINITY_DN2954_c0_g1_i1:117-1619(+)
MGNGGSGDSALRLLENHCTHGAHCCNVFEVGTDIDDARILSTVLHHEEDFPVEGLYSAASSPVGGTKDGRYSADSSPVGGTKDGRYPGRAFVALEEKISRPTSSPRADLPAEKDRIQLDAAPCTQEFPPDLRDKKVVKPQRLHDDFEDIFKAASPRDLALAPLPLPENTAVHDEKEEDEEKEGKETLLGRDTPSKQEQPSAADDALQDMETSADVELLERLQTEHLPPHERWLWSAGAGDGSSGQAAHSNWSEAPHANPEDAAGSYYVADNRHEAEMDLLAASHAPAAAAPGAGGASDEADEDIPLTARGARASEHVDSQAPQVDGSPPLTARGQVASENVEEVPGQVASNDALDDAHDQVAEEDQMSLKPPVNLGYALLDPKLPWHIDPVEIMGSMSPRSADSSPARRNAGTVDWSIIPQSFGLAARSMATSCQPCLVKPHAVGGNVRQAKFRQQRVRFDVPPDLDPDLQDEYGRPLAKKKTGGRGKSCKRIDKKRSKF